MSSLCKDNIIESELLTYLKTHLDNDDLYLFAQSFYLTIGNGLDQNKDFAISLDEVWKWLGYTRKSDCKSLLVKKFKKDVDYIEKQEEKAVCPIGQEGPSQENSFAEISAKPQGSSKGGRPTTQVLMTINCFKKLCLKADTQQANKVHDYYIKLEEILIKYTYEELQNQKELEIHNHLIRNNDSGLYISNTATYSDTGSETLEFGSTSNITNRKNGSDKKRFPKWNLSKFIGCKKPELLEQRFKDHPLVKKNRRKWGTCGEMISIKNVSIEEYENIASNIAKKINNGIEMRKLEIEKEKTEQEREKTIQSNNEVEKLRLEIELKKLNLNTTYQKEYILKKDSKDTKITNFVINNITKVELPNQVENREQLKEYFLTRTQIKNRYTQMNNRFDVSIDALIREIEDRFDVEEKQSRYHYITYKGLLGISFL